MTRYYIHFMHNRNTEIISAPNAKIAMQRAMKIYEKVSHVEEIEMDKKFIIKDWCGSTMFDGKTFKSFDDAWEFIYENIEDIDNAYDDVFVEEI